MDGGSSLSSLGEPRLLVEKAYVNGLWVLSSSQEVFGVSDKTGSLIGTCPDLNPDDLDRAIQAASAASLEWKHLSVAQRSQILDQICRLLLENKADVARIIVAETGKPAAEAEAEVSFAACFFHSFGRRAVQDEDDSALGNVTATEQFTSVFGMIVPVEYTFAIAAHKIAAILAAGCTVVIRPCEHALFSTNALAVVCEWAALPRGVLNTIPASKNASQMNQIMHEWAFNDVLWLV